MSDKPSEQQALEAVRTLIRWAGDNPERDGLRETPQRVIRAYEEFFAGYREDPQAILSKTFEQVEGYNDIVLLRDMRLESHCEHHIVPIIGRAHIAYLPQGRLVGLSKLARLLDVFAKRLQTQEILTVQVASAIEEALQPKGVAVIIDAAHQCMTTRGTHKTSSNTITSCLRGVFDTDASWRDRLFALLR